MRPEESLARARSCTLLGDARNIKCVHTGAAYKHQHSTCARFLPCVCCVEEYREARQEAIFRATLRTRGPALEHLAMKRQHAEHIAEAADASALDGSAQRHRNFIQTRVYEKNTCSRDSGSDTCRISTVPTDTGAGTGYAELALL